MHILVFKNSRSSGSKLNCDAYASIEDFTQPEKQVNGGKYDRNW